MSEITRVPLPPLAGGSLGKLWLGVFALVLAGAVLAGVGRSPLVDVTTLAAGSGPQPTPDQYIIAEISGQLDSGYVFQPRMTMPLQMAQVMPGFARALAQMQAGGTYDVRVPPSLGYGNRQRGPIPANSALNFHVHVLQFASEDQLRRAEEMMQQMRRGAPGGAAPGGGAGAAPGGNAGAPPVDGQ